MRDSYYDEKDLIGNILSDEEELCKKTEVFQRKPKPKLSLKSKPFEYHEPECQQSQQTDNTRQFENQSLNSIISTGFQSYNNKQKFFKTQTSIEIQSQNSSCVRLPQDFEKDLTLDQQNSNGTIGSVVAKRKKHHTMQPFQVMPQDTLFKSERIVDDSSTLRAEDFELVCGNQSVNRKLQHILDYGDEVQKWEIFLKIEKICYTAATDMFGNYTVQKLFEIGRDDWNYRLFCQLQAHFCELAKNIYGCRVIQKILEYIQQKQDMQEYFLQAILPHIRALFHDQYGNFVILSCFETFPPYTLEFIMPLMEEFILFMSKQTYGCRILQKVLVLYPAETTQRILSLLMNLAPTLCYQEYGNYIIQHILKNGQLKDKMVLCEIIRTHFESLSINKYGSNTVEKYIDYYGPGQIINELLKYSSNNEFVFFNLSINPYGNYVMKKVLILGDQYLHQLKLVLRSNPDIITRIKNSEYGQRVGLIMDSFL